MALHAWRYLVIDRIHISVGIGSKELHGFAVSQLKGLKDIQNDLVPNGKITLSLNDYVTRLNYYPTKKLKAAEIAVGVTKSKHCYFRLGLYPAKFQKGQFEHFKKMLGDLLPDFCYPKLFETGRVSYVEWAVDSLSHAAHSFIPFRAKCSCSSIFIDQHGTMGSTYVGSCCG